MAIEHLATRRNRLLVANAVGFVIWQTATFGPHLAGRAVAPLVIVIGLAGFLVWAAALWLLLRPVADVRARAVLDDELTRHHRQQAMLAGYWGMLFTTAGALAVASLVPMGAVLAVRIILVVGVAAPLLRFVVLERTVGGD